jgi:hypothetical protein
MCYKVGAGTWHQVRAGNIPADGAASPREIAACLYDSMFKQMVFLGKDAAGQPAIFKISLAPGSDFHITKQPFSGASNILAESCPGICYYAVNNAIVGTVAGDPNVYVLTIETRSQPIWNWTTLLGDWTGGPPNAPGRYWSRFVYSPLIQSFICWPGRTSQAFSTHQNVYILNLGGAF